jgi:hypothetical protein
VRARFGLGWRGRFQLVAQAGVVAVVVVFGDNERAFDLDGQRAVESERPAEGGEVLGDKVAVSGDSSTQLFGQDRAGQLGGVALSQPACPKPG